jgi:hypothetical protein
MMEEKKEFKGRARLIVMNFVRVMLVIAFIGAYLNGRSLVLIVSTLALFVTFLPKILNKLFGIVIPADLEVIVILLIYGSLFFGGVRGFYARIWWWEILLNLVAGMTLGIVGLTILIVLYKDEQLDASPVIIAIFTYCFAFAMAAFWEFFESGMDYFFGFHLQVETIFELMRDFAASAFGAVVISIAGYIYLKSGKTNMISTLITNFIEKNPILFRSKKVDTREDKIRKIIANGEKEDVEFKSTLRINLHTNEMDKKMEHSVLKTLAAFLNSNGGNVLIGVRDDKEIIGVEKDIFQSEDKYLLHLTNLIKHHIGKDFFHFMKVELVKLEENKSVVVVECGKSDKPAFLRMEQSEEFFMRNGPSTVRLDGSELIDYVKRRFKDD